MDRSLVRQRLFNFKLRDCCGCSAARHRCRRSVQCTPPGPQHGGLDPQLRRHLGQRPPARCQQRHRLPLELVRKRSSRRRHQCHLAPAGAYPRCPPFRGRVTPYATQRRSVSHVLTLRLLAPSSRGSFLGSAMSVQEDRNSLLGDVPALLLYPSTQESPLSPQILPLAVNWVTRLIVWHLTQALRPSQPGWGGQSPALSGPSGTRRSAGRKC